MDGKADKTGTARCFVAVNLPPDVKEIVARQQAQLRSQFEEVVLKDAASGHHALRWVQPELLHLTLLFLGDVSCARLDDAKAALESTCTGSSPFELRLCDLGFFPNAQRPRVLWTGLDGNVAALGALQMQVLDALRPFVAKSEEKKFRPHLTLARIKSEDKSLCRRIGQSLATALTTVEFADKNTRWQVNSVELMRSVLAPSGPEYSVEHSVRLGGI